MQRLLTVLALTALVVPACAAPGADREPAVQSTKSATPEASPRRTTTPVASPSPTAGVSTPNPAADAQLRTAAWANDVAAARRLIAAGANVNAKDDTVQSAYLIATSEGYDELAELTLARGAEVNDRDSWNGTGLIRAAERGHGLVVGRLLAAGIDRNHVNRIGYQAIHEAVWLGKDTPAYVETVRMLIAGGVQLDRPSRQEGLTPLQMAERKGYRTLAAALRAGRAAAPKRPDQALLGAAQRGDADAVALALRAGAKLEARDSSGRTALLLAVANNHLAVARLLVALGASPNAVDERRDTPWLVTGVTGSAQMAGLLLRYHPDFSARNRFGGTSLIPASERGHVDYVRRVAPIRAIEINHVNDLGWTALLEAVILGDGSARYVEIVKVLLANGADRSIADADGVTALQHARNKGYRSLAALLAN